MNQFQGAETEKRFVDFLSFTCPECGGYVLAWERRPGRPGLALVTSFFITEGNAYPFLHGRDFDRASFPTAEGGADRGAWKCKSCGHRLIDEDGRPVKSMADIFNYLIRNCSPRAGERLPEPGASLDTINDYLFAKTDAPGLLSVEYNDVLRCPCCGHDEFIEYKSCVMATPVRVENGCIQWWYAERLFNDEGDNMERHYLCSKCGFEAPEQIEDWMDEGCPENFLDFEDY